MRIPSASRCSLPAPLIWHLRSLTPASTLPASSH